MALMDDLKAALDAAEDVLEGADADASRLIVTFRRALHAVEELRPGPNASRNEWTAWNQAGALLSGAETRIVSLASAPQKLEPLVAVFGRLADDIKSTTTATETPLLLKTEEVAELLAISDHAARKLVRLGELPTVRLRSMVRVPAAALRRWVEQHTENPKKVGP